MSIRFTFRPAVVALAFLAASSVLAQTRTTSTMTGVVHGDDGFALKGASVTIHGSQNAGWVRSVATDAKGMFGFSDLAPGEYTVTVERTRYVSLTQEHLRPAAGETLDLNVTLASSAADAHPGFGELGFMTENPATRTSSVIVTGPSGKAIRCSNRPNNVDTVTRPTVMLGNPPATLHRDRVRLLNAQPR